MTRRIGDRSQVIEHASRACHIAADLEQLAADMLKAGCPASAITPLRIARAQVLDAFRHSNPQNQGPIDGR